MKLPMALFVGLAVLGAGAAADKPAAEKPAADKPGPRPTPEPFYQRFLIPGNPLDEQIREQEKRIDANPESAALHNDLGNLLARRRFPKEAQQQYEIAMKLDKKSYLPAYNMGIVAEMEGRTSRAIRAYERCVDLNRGFPPGLFRLGRLYEREGRDSAAVKAYAKALRIDPSMRDPARNPLVVDARLLERASLANYHQDLARASLESDARYADESRFRRIPYDRTIDSEELGEPASPAAPGEPAAAAPAPRAPAALPAAPGQTRPQALVPAPASAVPAPTQPPANPRAPARVPPGAPAYSAATPSVPLITPVPPPPTPEE